MLKFSGISVVLRRSCFIGPLVMLISGFWLVSAQESGNAKKITINGFSSSESGQVVQGSYGSGLNLIKHYWSHQVYCGVGFNADINDQFTIAAKVQGKLWNPYPNQETRAYRKNYFSLWINEARATYSLGEPQNPWLAVTGGYFIHKYNPEVRNLGEYLFRSTISPGYLLNYFDFPAARLLGFRAGLNFFDGQLKSDFFALEESEIWPFGDITLAWVGSYNLAKIIDIGGGLGLSRVFSVNEKYTTPKSKENRQVKYIDTNSLPVYDESAFYTFKGTKLMGRGTIDLKQGVSTLLKELGSDVSLDFLGREAFKIYGEIGVLGVKNYSYWYEDIKRRRPIMFGVNCPNPSAVFYPFSFIDNLHGIYSIAEKVLAFDVIACEFEHYAFPFNANYQLFETGGRPLPSDESPGSWDPESYKDNAWKWSVYSKKTIFPGLSVTLQLSRDHLRLNFIDGFPYYAESLVKPGDWAWILKITGSL